MRSDDKLHKNYKRLIRFIVYAFILFLFIGIAFPNLLFFLPNEWQTVIANTSEDLLGVSQWKASIENFTLRKGFAVIVIILALFCLSNLLKWIIGLIKLKTNRAKSIRQMLLSAISYVIFIIGLLWCITTLGVDLSSAMKSVGLLALIIGFAADGIIRDVITGISLVFENAFVVGDIIEVGGFRGEVISMGMRVTKVKDIGGNIKIINNSDIKNVLNRSLAQTTAFCDIPISYACNLEETEEILKTILEDTVSKYPQIFTKGINYLGVQELAESSVNLRVTAVVDEKNIFNAPRIIYREVKIGFDNNSVEIPFNQIVVHNAKG